MSLGLRRFVTHAYMFLIGLSLSAILFLDGSFVFLLVLVLMAFMFSWFVVGLEIEKEKEIQRIVDEVKEGR